MLFTWMFFSFQGFVVPSNRPTPFFVLEDGASGQAADEDVCERSPRVDLHANDANA